MRVYIFLVADGCWFSLYKHSCVFAVHMHIDRISKAFQPSTVACEFQSCSSGYVIQHGHPPPAHASEENPLTFPSSEMQSCRSEHSARHRGILKQ